MSSLITKDPIEKYDYVDITADSNNNEEQNNQGVQFFEWTLNFNEINTIPDFAAPANLGTIFFHTIRYGENAVYIWIGDKSSKLQNLTVAMKTAYSNDPLTSVLISNKNLVEDTSCQTNSDLACKLSKRLKKQVICGLNVGFSVVADSDTQSCVLKQIEMALFKEIKTNPHKF